MFFSLKYSSASETSIHFIMAPFTICARCYQTHLSKSFSYGNQNWCTVMKIWSRKDISKTAWLIFPVGFYRYNITTSHLNTANQLSHKILHYLKNFHMNNKSSDHRWFSNHRSAKSWKKCYRCCCNLWPCITVASCPGFRLTLFRSSVNTYLFSRNCAKSTDPENTSLARLSPIALSVLSSLSASIKPSILLENSDADVERCTVFTENGLEYLVQFSDRPLTAGYLLIGKTIQLN